MATLTAGLQNLRRQVDAAFPDRDRTSDGWIGDKPHQGETSGHNPDDTPGSKPAWDRDSDSVPEVRAWDADSDLGIDPQALVDHIRRLPGIETVIRYMIFDRKEYHSRYGYEPIPYTGPSAHTEHIHFEGAWTQEADNNTTFDYRLEELHMPLTPADLTAVAKAVWSYDADTLTAGTQSAAGLLTTENRRSNATTNQQLPELVKAVSSLSAQLSELTGRDFVNEDVIVTGVLASLTPERIAAAIPATVAAQVVSLLSAKLAA